MSEKLTILANNCFCQFMYKALNIEYQSPTIDLLIHPIEYMKYLNNLNVPITQYTRISMMESQYGYCWYNKGLMPYDPNVKDWLVNIGGIFEVSPIHYKQFHELTEKWIRRKDRINPKNILLTLNDADFMSGPLLLDFLNFRLEKVLQGASYKKAVILYNQLDISRYYLPYLSDYITLMKETERCWIYKFKSDIDTIIVLYKPNLWRNGQEGDEDYPPRYFREDFDLECLLRLEY